MVRLVTFEVPEDTIIPLPSELVEKALAWARGADEAAERIQFYSAEDVPETPPSSAQPKRQARRRGPAGGTTGADRGPAAAPKRRPTVNQLAESLAPYLACHRREVARASKSFERGLPQ